MKDFIPDQILVEWFIKSLLPKITEEQVIAQAQCLDLVYMQLGTLHEKIPNLPKHGQITSTPSRSHANSMIGSVSTKRKKKSSKNSSPIITLPDSLTGDSFVEILC